MQSRIGPPHCMRSTYFRVSGDSVQHRLEEAALRHARRGCSSVREFRQRDGNSQAGTAEDQGTDYYHRDRRKKSFSPPRCAGPVVVSVLGCCTRLSLSSLFLPTRCLSLSVGVVPSSTQYMQLTRRVSGAWLGCVGWRTVGPPTAHSSRQLSLDREQSGQTQTPGRQETCLEE